MKQYNNAFLLIVILAGATVCAMTLSCKKSKTSTSSGKPTLYDTLGGPTLVIDPTQPDTTIYIEKGYLAIRTIVDTTMFTFANDPLINSYFYVLQNDDTLGNPSEYESLGLAMTNFIATAAGCTNPNYAYNGPDMYAAHNPDSNSKKIRSAVTDSAFNEFVYDIAQSSINYGFSAQVVSQIGSMLYKYEGQVVQQ
jgi:hypothetical protein